MVGCFGRTSRTCWHAPAGLWLCASCADFSSCQAISPTVKLVKNGPKAFPQSRQAVGRTAPARPCYRKFTIFEAALHGCSVPARTYPEAHPQLVFSSNFSSSFKLHLIMGEKIKRFRPKHPFWILGWIKSVLCCFRIIFVFNHFWHGHPGWVIAVFRNRIIIVHFFSKVTCPSLRSLFISEASC